MLDRGCHAQKSLLGGCTAVCSKHLPLPKRLLWRNSPWMVQVSLATSQRPGECLCWYSLDMQGCLKPITVRIPPGSILSPSPTAAVVGGNVLTSQRVTDVVLKAFNAAAASQVHTLFQQPFWTPRKELPKAASLRAHVHCWRGQRSVAPQTPLLSECQLKRTAATSSR